MRHCIGIVKVVNSPDHSETSPGCYIHAVGPAIQTAANIVGVLQKRMGSYLSVSTETGTVPLVRDYIPRTAGKVGRYKYINR